MGLDITAYSRLERVGNHAENWECEDDKHIEAFAYAVFTASFRGVPIVGEGEASEEKFIFGGCYAITNETRTHDFRAGSYGGYNRWRENLQMQFNPERDPDKPFYELIWFADNEGTIGPDAAKDLLADFIVHEADYEPWYDPAHDTYKDWKRAFELAADSGLVVFA